MPGPLDGIIVLDFTWHLAGPYGVMQLADLGAEVWKIEQVAANEDNRGGGPIVEGINTYFFSVNRGKQSLALDLRSPEGKEIVYGLAPQVDVLTENFRPGTMERLGFGYERMAALNPRLIYASTSGFGQTGPYRDRGAVDVIVQGMGGVMSITGHPDGPIARPGYSIGDMAGGLFTAIGVLSALVERDRSGKGQRIDVAMLDAQVALLENAIIRYCATGEVPGRIGTRHPLTTPFQAFETSDGGWFVLAGVKDWELFCATIGRDDLILDERFKTNRLRTKNHAALEPILIEVFKQKPRDEWLALLAPVCLVGPVNGVDQVVADPQVQARQMVVELPAWNGARLSVSNTPVKLSRTPGGPHTGADAPGGHTAQILRERLGYTDEQIAALAEKGVIAAPRLPAAAD
ncbi:MAG TPA: CaiB/BaiF CoA-transferase family protein [Dehalococcoidia bacterium]|nr:CaiB/BaiF CoA-transferase family protein [Dehalococcoidia bacterium]